MSKNIFDIHSLESEALVRLFHEAVSLARGLRVEMVGHGTRSLNGEEHPAATAGLAQGEPTILFAGSLGRDDRIEAIAHECLHLLLVYRYGMGLVGRRVPRCGDREDVFHYFMSMSGDWLYLLGQIVNTVHHLILKDYLRGEYGIESRLYLRLLCHNFSILSREDDRDRESQCANGLIAFEYEKLIGRLDGAPDPSCQTDLFWRAFSTAQERFGRYSFQSIPTASVYEESILSFLEGLGYQREDFLFFPERGCGSRFNEERPVEQRGVCP